MTDIAAIGAIVSSLKTATDIAKFLRESDFSLERAELKLKLAELVGALADAKLEMASIQELVSERDERIKELEEAFESKDQLVRNRDAYYTTDSKGDPVGTPLCLRCWDVDHKQYHLHHDAKDRFVMVCPACGGRYEARRAQTISIAE
jgi:hypothetical protein